MKPMQYQQPDELTLTPMKEDIRLFSWTTFRADLFAGLTVALVTVPQAMAYALVAGLPLKCGLLAAIFSALIASLFGSSRHLIVGPNTAISIMVQYATSEILFTYFRDVVGPERDFLAVQILMQLTFFVAVIQVLVAVLRLGRLTQFVSHSVVVAYLTGTMFAVIISQLFTFLGMEKPDGVSSLFDKAVYVLTHSGAIHWPTAIIGVSGVIIMFVVRKISRKIPAAALTILLTSVLVFFLGFSSESEQAVWGVDLEAIGAVTTVGDAGDVSGIIPQFSRPFFDHTILSSLLPAAFAIALLSILETSSVAKTMASLSGQRLSINQEILGIGLGNLVSSFIGGLPCAASPIRTTILYQSGGKTRFAAIFNALGAWVVIILFGFLITKAPLAALSSILLVSAFSLVHPKQILLCLKATSADAFVLIATFVSCLFFTLDVAFYIGIVLSVTFYLNKAAVPQLVECIYDENGKMTTKGELTEGQKVIRVINVQGELFFGAADLFQAALKSIAEDDTGTQVMILRLKNARALDATACLAIERIYEFLRSSGRYLLACGLTHQSWEVLSDAGLVELIGKKNLFLYDYYNPKLSLQKTLCRAKELIASGKTSPRPSRLKRPHPVQPITTEVEPKPVSN